MSAWDAEVSCVSAAASPQTPVCPWDPGPPHEIPKCVHPLNDPLRGKSCEVPNGRSYNLSLGLVRDQP